MALMISFLARKIWFMSGKHLLKLPEEYAGLFSHGQMVEVEIKVGAESYRLSGVVKHYRRGVFVKLPPEARALLNERGLRVRLYA
ncbi:MAG: hypothetical protein GSR85_10035 [Desulfurococcales archaeon]|nr:hypothetical protein [Desulfurococcales archaeon]